VLGPAGAGKTRLRHELLDALARDGTHPLTLEATGTPETRASPFAALGRAVRAAAGMVDGEPAPLCRDKVVRRITRSLPPRAAPRVAAFVAELAGVPLPDDALPELSVARRDPQTMRDGIRESFIAWIDAESAAHPTVLVVEDLQWVDAPSAKLVAASLEELSDRPLSVLALGRPEAERDRPELIRAGPALRLAPLPVDAVRELAAPFLPEAQIDQMLERTEPHPLRVEEIIRATRAGTTPVGDEPVRAMVRARLSALPEDQRRVLRAAAVFGERFWPDGVARLVGADVDLEAALRSLVQEELIVERRSSRFVGRDELRFRHAVVVEAARETLSEADRRVGHRLAAQWLEERGERDCAVLADHWVRGDRPQRATELYLRAATQCLDGDDLDGALDHADRAERCGARGSLAAGVHRIRAEAYRWRGRFGDAERALRRALRRLDEGSAEWFDTLADLMLTCIVQGRWAAAREHVERARRCAPADERAEVARAICRGRWLAAGLLEGEGVDEAADWLDESASLLDHDDGALRGVHHMVAASAAMQRGDLEGNAEHLSLAIDAYRRIGARRKALNLRVDLGYALAELGHDERAERVLEDALAEGERFDERWSMIVALENLALVRGNLGRLEEAWDAAERALALSSESSPRRFHGGAHIYRARIARDAGRPEQSEAEARRALEVLGEGSALRAEARAYLAEALLAQGRAAEALEQATAARFALEAGTVAYGEATIRRIHALALEASGATDEAKHAIRLAYELLLERARELSPEARGRFLRDVPDNARLVREAERLGQVSS